VDRIDGKKAMADHFRFDDQGIEKSRIPIVLPYFDFEHTSYTLLSRHRNLVHNHDCRAFTSIIYTIPTWSAAVREHNCWIGEQPSDYTQ
jgi:hypothetical protein